MNTQEAVSSLKHSMGAVARNPLGFMRKKDCAPGASPGIDHLPEASAPPQEGKVTISCVDYGPEHYQSYDVGDLEDFLARERPQACAVRWINVNGLHAYTIKRLQRLYPFHSLAAEDVLHSTPRPKVEPYADHIFIVAQMLMESNDKPCVEQVSMILFEGVLLTFQERPGDVWDRVRARIRTQESRLRTHGSDFLVYALLDAIVDNFYPVLEHFGDRLDDIEGKVLNKPTTQELQHLYSLKQELVLLRRVIWPTRQAIDELQRSTRVEFGEQARTYLRDVYDHAFQVIDVVEAYRETASSLTDLYMSSIANRMNEVMKVLTIMASVFIPITFLAGVYGMNFEHMPELGWKYSYGVFWAISLLTIAGLIVFFRRQGWIGHSADGE